VHLGENAILPSGGARLAGPDPPGPTRRANRAVFGIIFLLRGGRALLLQDIATSQERAATRGKSVRRIHIFLRGIVLRGFEVNEYDRISNQDASPLNFPS
jgi:hypothetical protein